VSNKKHQQNPWKQPPDSEDDNDQTKEHEIDEFQDVPRSALLPFGRDEMNLAECPFTLLRDGRGTRKGELPKTIETKDWVITGCDAFGLPSPNSEEVYLALLALTKRQGFQSQRVHFSMYEVVSLLRWPDNGQSYHRVRMALRQLKGVNIYTRYFWDQGEGEHRERGFSVIDVYDIPSEGKGKRGRKARPDGQLEMPFDWFKWNEVLFKSFQDGFIKQLDLDTYLSLRRPMAKRIFRFVDKKLYRRQRFSIGAVELCRDYLGVTGKAARRYPSKAYEKLLPSLDELEGHKIFHIEVERTKPDWLLTFERWPKPAVLPEPPKQEGYVSGHARAMVERFYRQLTGQSDDYEVRGITEQEMLLADQLLKEIGPERLEFLIDYAVAKGQKPGTRFRVERFAGIRNYQAVALAVFDKLEQRRQGRERERVKAERKEQAQAARFETEWQAKPLEEKVAQVLGWNEHMLLNRLGWPVEERDWQLVAARVEQEYAGLPPQDQTLDMLCGLAREVMLDYVREQRQ